MKLRSDLIAKVSEMYSVPSSALVNYTTKQLTILIGNDVDDDDDDDKRRQVASAKSTTTMSETTTTTTPNDVVARVDDNDNRDSKSKIDRGPSSQFNEVKRKIKKKNAISFNMFRLK